MSRPTTFQINTSTNVAALTRPLKSLLTAFVPLSRPSLGYALVFLSSIALTLGLWPALHIPFRFMYNCFLKPFLHHGSGDQKNNLEAFYAGQADLYDTTRSHLLKGRETMLQLLAAHLKAQPVARLPVAAAPAKPKIWVDLGGGTGWNIEKM